MAVAGWCQDCGQHVWLNEQWGCVNGHGWDRISGWYDPDTGQPVTPYWQQPAPAPAPAPAPTPEQPAPAPAASPEPVPVPAAAPADAPAHGSRLALLADVLAAFSAYPTYSAHYGTDTDIVVDNSVVDATWTGGGKRVTYEANMKADEGTKTLFFWEAVTERGGLSFGSAGVESYSTSGTKRSGKVKERVVGADGSVHEYEWDYGATRALVETVAASHGWKLKTVLRKKAVKW